MGVLSFVKSIFLAERLEEESVKLEELQQWFDAKASANFDYLKGQVLGINGKIGEEVEKAKQRIESLKSATLRNPNIPERAKHFMEGNREAYIKKAGIFVESLKLPEDVSGLGEFFINFSRELEEFGKSTGRPYAILREFLEDEVSAVAESIRVIDSHVKEMKEQKEKAKIADLELGSKLIRSMFSRMQRKEDLQREIEEKKRQLELSGQDAIKMEKGIIGMREGDEFREHSSAKQELEGIKGMVKAKEEEIIHPFSVLERPLRKFERSVVADKDILDAYMDSPVNGITQDFGLKISRILENMRKSVEDNTLELKDKQKEIALREIGNLDRDFLSRFQAEYGRLKKQEKDMQEKVKSYDIMERINKAEEDLRIRRSLLKTIGHSIESKEEELRKIDIGMTKKVIKEKVRDALRIKLEIAEN
jgi:hypothetical protein